MPPHQSPSKPQPQHQQDRLLNAEREIAEYRRRLTDLELEVSTLKQTKATCDAAKSLVVCLIDGDGYVFHKDLLMQGNKGGRVAASRLRKHIVGHCKSNSDVLVNVFLNQNGLKYKLKDCFGISFNVSHQFVNGFSSAPCVSVVDVGEGKEAADAKVQEHLKIFARNTDVEKVYFGGEHDNSYAPTLAAVENEGYLNKVVLLRGYNPLAQGLKIFDLAMLESRDLFLDEPLPDNPKGVTSAKASPVPQQSQLPPIQQEIRTSSGPASPAGPEASNNPGMPETPTRSALGLTIEPTNL